MRKIRTLILLLVMANFVISCDNDDEVCLPQFIQITNLENEYDCENTPYQMDIDLSEQYVIIRSQLVFDELVSGSCTPEIDFESYDLLIGKKGLSSGFDTIEYNGLIRDCNTGQLSLTITFVLNATAEAPNATYHALVPKLAPDEGINVTVLTP